MNPEIIERSSGWWVVNLNYGAEGPFPSIKKAQKYLAYYLANHPVKN